MSNLFWLTDEQMARLQPYFPKSHGRQRVDDRRVLSGIIFVNRKDRRLVPNACYVIADETGAATYKRWRPDTGWGPVSTNEDHAPLTLRAGAEPTIIGRVKLSLIRM